MQWPITLWRTIATLALATAPLALASCDAGAPSGEPEPTRTQAATTEDRAATRAAGPAELESIQRRADAAFAALDEPNTRSESRIGPQPWPADLPARWPRLEGGRVLADTRRNGDRLLLVDLPGEPDAARERYGAALRAEGFEVVPGADRGAGSLRATGPTAAADLTFYPRETVTRVEILFRDPPTG
ncbi:MAG: hypothetical protein NXI30_00905 [bacterium]|nr:hypothetical protein [bacterium]